jgi:hypothetical protein
MHFIKYLIVLTALVVFQTSTLDAQLKKRAQHFKEGEIKYKLKVIGDPELSELFRETTLTLYLKDDKIKMDLRIMGGFASMQLLTNHKKNVMLMDMPMLPEKVSVPMEGENNIFQQLLTASHTNQSPSDFGEIRYYPKDKKRIEKQKCYRAELPIKGSNEVIVLYLAQKMDANLPIPFLQNFEKLEGLPLQIELNAEGLRLQLTAVDIHEYELSPETFEVPEDYMPRSLKELKIEIDNIFNGGEPDGVGL